MKVYPSRESELRIWIENFVSACNVHATPLGLIPAELANIQAKADEFIADLNNLETIRAQAKAKTTTKDASKEALTDLVSLWNKRFRTTATVTEQMLEDLGLPIYKTPAPQTPKQPTQLVAEATADGRVTLTFNRNGNISTTVFVFQVSDNSSGPWEYLGTSTSTRTTFAGFVVGAKKYIRVFARMGTQDGPASATTLVYPDGMPVPLSIAA